MALVKTKPTSPGRRFVVQVAGTDLHKGAPHPSLVSKLDRQGGRNNTGRITVRHPAWRFRCRFQLWRELDVVPGNGRRLLRRQEHGR